MWRKYPNLEFARTIEFDDISLGSGIVASHFGGEVMEVVGTLICSQHRVKLFKVFIAEFEACMGKMTVSVGDSQYCLI